jgi:hypothetical protein
LVSTAPTSAFLAEISGLVLLRVRREDEARAAFSRLLEVGLAIGVAINERLNGLGQRDHVSVVDRLSVRRDEELASTMTVEADHVTAACHRLGGGETETFVEPETDEKPGLLQRRGHFGFRHSADDGELPIAEAAPKGEDRAQLLEVPGSLARHHGH